MTTGTTTPASAPSADAGAGTGTGPSADAWDPGAAAARATAAILDDVRRGPERATLVDSPPGAGKSTLVVRAARELVAAGERLMIVAQTNSQVDDLVERLAADAPDVTVGRLHSKEARPSAHVLRHGNVTASTQVAELLEHDVVLSTAAKWQWVQSAGPDGGSGGGRGGSSGGVRPWRHAIVDEAYQMRSDALLAVGRLFERALFVGDPGQLDPFTMVDNERWAGLDHDPSSSAVATLLAHHPRLRPHRLPVSWRLPASAAPLVSRAFYPEVPFRSGTGPGDRRLELSAPTGGTAYDEVVETAAASGWGLLELPAGFAVRTDPEAVRATARVVRTLLDRSAVAHSERGAAPVTADRIAVGTAHRDQAAAIRAALAELGVPTEGGAAAPDAGADADSGGPEGVPAAAPGVTVDTANRLQGREYDVTVVLHPLSGRSDATAFHLEAGRLCVLTSRHRHACVVVTRAGLPELLDAHPSAEPVRLGIPATPVPDGWEANHAVLQALAAHRVRVPG